MMIEMVHITKKSVRNVSLCDYSDVYTLVEGRTSINGQGAYDAAIGADRNNKKVVFKKWA